MINGIDPYCRNKKCKIIIFITVQRIFFLAYKNGDIYKSQYEGWYDERNEKFLTETKGKETDYKDATTGIAYKKQCEEAYFFKMSKYQQRLLQHLRSNPKAIEPQKSYQYIMRRLEDDKLEDLCVSRSTFSWGIPVPLEEGKGHIIYVWFDVLSNYLTGIGYFDESAKSNKAFWPANVPVIGKDIVWFHCDIWPYLGENSKIGIDQCIQTSLISPQKICCALCEYYSYQMWP